MRNRGSANKLKRLHFDDEERIFKFYKNYKLFTSTNEYNRCPHVYLNEDYGVEETDDPKVFLWRSNGASSSGY